MNITKHGYNGFYLPDYGISLDASHVDARITCISHAHADHMPRNRNCNVIASAATVKLMNVRGFKGEALSPKFKQPLEIDNVRITLYPAGHILGSAMFFIETDDGSLLYTGDYRAPASPATEGFSIPENIDYFLTEATFGLPIYKWKSHDELAEEIRSFAINSLNDGYTPVFLGYNLGKAQEIMYMLAPLDLPVQIHGAGYKLSKIYSNEGWDLGNYSSYDRSSCEGNILVAPSSALAGGFASNVKKKRVAYCSGWAALESRRTQLNADRMIPLSDHIDFFELVSLCKKTDPKKVYITHTPNPQVLQYFLDQEEVKSEHLN
jgi:putative mRNA 3-end processing factor